MDNECSKDLQQALKKGNLNFQLVPPNQYWRNTAERAIWTFNNHLLTGLATCDPQFPIYEWDCLCNKAELTTNLLRNSRVNPSLSAHAYLAGIHNFNRTPLASPVTKGIVHTKSDKHASWDFHGEDGWYVGPEPQYYLITLGMLREVG